MATTGTEKHCRLCLMLNKGGTKACHSLLLKRVEELTPNDHQTHPWTVHEFLKSKKNEISKSKMSKEKIQVLFPRTGVTDLAKWDLSLFCTVLTTYCGLKHLTRLDVERLRTLRNELCHMNEPHIDDEKYQDYFDTIKVVATRILDNNNETKASIEKLLNDIHEGPLSLVETLKEMHTFYSMEMDIREKLEYVTNVDERVLQKVEKFDELFERFDTKLEQIDSKLDNETSSKLHSKRNNFLLPGVEIFFDLKNLSTEEEQRMSTVLEQLFEEVINEEDDFISCLPADSYIKLREAVRKTFKLFLMKGWRITNARHECVQLHIRCLTFKSLAALFREHIQGQINMELTDLSEAVSETVGENGSLVETAIYKDEFWGVMDKTITAVEEFLTDQDSDIYPQLQEELLSHHGENKHALALTARHVANKGVSTFSKECGNELDTCLSLLKTELETEFNAPQVEIKASHKPKKIETATHNKSSVGDQTTMRKEEEIEKNVPIMKKSGDKQDSYLDQFKKEYGKECDTQDRNVQDETLSKYENIKTSKDQELHKYAYEDTLDLKSLKKLNTSLSMSESEWETNIDPVQDSLKASHKPDKDMSSASTSMSFDVQRLLHEHQSKASVDKREQDKEQTIALLELYKSQRAIAHYLELAYLSFREHPDIANKVTTASEYARRKHQLKDECGWDNYVDVIRMFIKDLLYFDMSEIDDTIRDAQRLRKETKYLQESYIELQGTIRNLTEHCTNFTSLNKEAKPHVKTMSSLEKSSEKERVHKFDELQLKIDIKRTSSETELVMMKWMMSKSPVKHSIGKLEMKTSKEEELRRKLTKDEYWRYEETKVTKLLRPGYALTGGLSFRSYSDVMNLFRSVSRGEELETLMMLQIKTRSTEGAMGVEMMRTQRIEALERLETIRKQENDDGGLKCLKEVEKHLKYIEIQFGRMNDCWSQMIYDFQLLKARGRSGTLLKLTMTNKGRMIREEWGYVHDLFLSYKKEILNDTDLYRFLSEKSTVDSSKRRQDLFLEIGKEISGTHVTLDSGKPSDQHKDPDIKPKEKRFSGKGISGKSSLAYGKPSYQQTYTDF